jgi:PPOX class probable F420-dependent enzyme
MELAEALDFARGRSQGILATIAADGRPHLTNIMYALDDAGVARVSITDGRVKTKNLQRDPRAALHVAGDTFWQYVVLEGPVTPSAVTTDPHDETADELIALYRALAGEHPDWDEYRAAMVADHRLVARLTATRALGITAGS